MQFLTVAFQSMRTHHSNSKALHQHTVTVPIQEVYGSDQKGGILFSLNRRLITYVSTHATVPIQKLHGSATHITHCGMRTHRLNSKTLHQHTVTVPMRNLVSGSGFLLSPSSA